MFGIAFVAGPLIGGWLTENLGWHWIFYVNIPIGIVALIVIQRLLPTVKTQSATRNFDLIGGAIFTVAMVFLLVGLTNKQFSDWTEPTVGGFILIGIVGTLLFIFAESRAKEPIIPLDLWKGRTYSATDGLGLLRRLRVLRRDRVPAALVPGRRGLLADELRPRGPAAHGRPDRQLDRVRPDRVPDRPLQVADRRLGRRHGLRGPPDDPAHRGHPGAVVWLWMFIAGLGVGPTFSVFTIVIQNAVPFRQLGVATSNLTFFRQIGGTIALAFVGTIFGSTFQEQPRAADGRRGRAASR